jgi:polyvinyl alcohol dehydrogenase (cytochrome)
MDAGKGCDRCTNALGSRNTPQIGEVDGRKVLAFSVGRGDVVLLDAKTGDQIWRADGRPANGSGNIRGGVVIYRDKIIVPISASGVGAGQNPKFECCVGHGAVVALSARDGKRLWEYHTMAEAQYTGKVSRTGVKQRGPSGAPIWALPTIDAKRNRVIVATGENTSHPGTDTSDAIIALDLDTGKPAWVFQAMKADVWNMSCNDRELQKSGPNCPNLYESDAGRDFDFGATPVLVSIGGRDVVLDGQKSGHVWALDAATGKVLWQDRVGEGSALGGVHWGVTTDGQRLFAPIADSLLAPDEQARNKAGVYAYRISDGKQVWAHVAKADCPPDRAPNVVACATKYGYSVAPITVDGAVVAATLDGKVTVLDGKTGKVLRVIDTAGPVKTLNGVPGKGGSIDAHGLSAGDGAVFVMSGYGAFGQTPGNVLIALRPRK